MFEQRREQLDKSLNKLDKLMQRWDERLTLDNLALAERYLKGELRIHVHLLWASEEFCAIFERKLPVSGPDWDAGRGNFGGVDPQPTGGSASADSAEVDYEVSVCAADGEQEFVFVRDVELMEPPKRAVPSVVRFGGLDKVHRRLRRSLYLSRRTGFKSIGGGGRALEHGKSGVGLDFFPFGTNQLADQKIEGGSKVVDGIADDGAPPERGLRRNLDLENALAGLRLVVGNDFIGFALPEPFNQRFEVADVLFGPFDLDPDAAEIGLADHVSEE